MELGRRVGGIGTSSDTWPKSHVPNFFSPPPWLRIKVGVGEATFVLLGWGLGFDPLGPEF